MEQAEDSGRFVYAAPISADDDEEEEDKEDGFVDASSSAEKVSVLLYYLTL